MTNHVVLTGASLDAALLFEIASGATVSIAEDSTENMAKGREVVDRYFRDSIPAYGLTTGLGMRSSQMLSVEAGAEFSYRTVRGRAQAVGQLLCPMQVRAVMAVRLNTLLSGGAGASDAIAPALETALNHHLVPAMPSIGSIGTGDLVALAALAHALIGEGEMLVDGNRRPAAEVLAQAGIVPLRLLPKDGAVLCNNTAFSSALSALAAVSTQHLLTALQVAAALSLEGFQGNLSPFAETVLQARPQPGQLQAGNQIRNLLNGGPLALNDKPRRLQDPLSFRCVAQVHGAAFAALTDLQEELSVDLNCSSDNPLVLIAEGLCVSNGNFHLPRLTQTLDSLSRSLAWCATDSVSRVQRLMHAPHSALPPLLSSDSADSAGFGPMLKPLEALRAEIVHLANPVPILPSHNADGIEDSVTFSALAASKLDQLLKRLSILVAFELVAACQAIDLRNGGPVPPPPIAPKLQSVYTAVRARSPFLFEDRPIGKEIEAISEHLVLNGTISVLAELSE
jgi:histidine ammonia-lyase